MCGQIIDEKIEICPNDGTNLKLSGRPLNSKQKAEPSDHSADSSYHQDNHSELSTNNGKFQTLGGYKRHDEGGLRHPGSEKNSSDYSDRRSRLPHDSRTAMPNRRKKTDVGSLQSDRSESEDNRFEEYKNKRASIWKERESANLDLQQIVEKQKVNAEKILKYRAAPLASLGMRLFFLGEDGHAGPVAGAEIDLHAARSIFRAGISTLIGVRTLPNRNEMVFLEGLSAGIQLPQKVSPFIIAKGGIGMMATNRFETAQFYLLTTIGFEGGIDIWFSKSQTAVSLSLGFMRCTVNDAYWHSVTYKLSVGF